MYSRKEVKVMNRELDLCEIKRIIEEIVIETKIINHVITEGSRLLILRITDHKYSPSKNEKMVQLQKDALQTLDKLGWDGSSFSLRLYTPTMFEFFILNRREIFLKLNNYSGFENLIREQGSVEDYQQILKNLCRYKNELRYRLSLISRYKRGLI
jgi:hypothetical protein